jgi:RsmE family RNA methyltransferase
MNIILLDKSEIANDSYVDLPATDRRSEHICNVLHAHSGDSVKIGIIDGLTGSGIVKYLKQEEVLQEPNASQTGLRIEFQTLKTPPPQAVPVTLILAMQRPKTVKKILQSATAMGVKKIYIIETWKVEKSYWTSPLLNPENLSEQLLLGLEQAGDTIMPEIIIKKRFKPFTEDELPEIISDSTALIAHPYSDLPCPHKIDKQAVVAIGPEGGFTEYEVKKMQSIGMSAVNIGERPLRSEFAVTAILAKLF